MTVIANKLTRHVPLNGMEKRFLRKLMARDQQYRNASSNVGADYGNSLDNIYETGNLISPCLIAIYHNEILICIHVVANFHFISLKNQKKTPAKLSFFPNIIFTYIAMTICTKVLIKIRNNSLITCIYIYHKGGISIFRLREVSRLIE